jgi:hypothetical protein
MNYRIYAKNPVIRGRFKISLLSVILFLFLFYEQHVDNCYNYEKSYSEFFLIILLVKFAIILKGMKNKFILGTPTSLVLF